MRGGGSQVGPATERSKIREKPWLHSHTHTAAVHHKQVSELTPVGKIRKGMTHAHADGYPFQSYLCFFNHGVNKLSKE